MKYIGIDPGMSGYLAVIDSGDVYHFPAPTRPTGKGERRRYDIPGMIDLLRMAATGAELCVIEKQQSFPGQGVASTFTTGLGYGLWLAGLTAAGIPFEAVAPATWKAKLRIKALPSAASTAASRKKATKALAIATAQRLFPGVSLLPTDRSRVPSADMAESLLLAYYASRRDTDGTGEAAQ